MRNNSHNINCELLLFHSLTFILKGKYCTLFPLDCKCFRIPTIEVSFVKVLQINYKQRSYTLINSNWQQHDCWCSLVNISCIL